MVETNPETDLLRVRIQANILRKRLISRHGTSSHIARMLQTMSDFEIIECERRHMEVRLQMANAQEVKS